MSGYNTLLLDRTVWDIVLNAAGNIAVASPPYSVNQDVASACRTFIGECWYDVTIGVPYWADILGQQPPLSLVKSLLQTAAETVPGCTNAVVYISSFVNRAIVGQVQFTYNGTTQAAII